MRARESPPEPIPRPPVSDTGTDDLNHEQRPPLRPQDARQLLHAPPLLHRVGGPDDGDGYHDDDDDDERV